jgi:hypothetical protein
MDLFFGGRVAGAMPAWAHVTDAIHWWFLGGVVGFIVLVFFIRWAWAEMTMTREERWKRKYDRQLKKSIKKMGC